MVAPLPGPSATRAMEPTSTVSMDPSTALSPRVFTLRRMSCRRAGRTSGRSAEELCIMRTAASFSTRTTMPTAPSSSITRSCVPYSPTLSTRRLASALSARWCENTTNSSLETSPKTVATSPSTFTTRPASPSCLPCTHRTWLPSLNDLRRWSRSMSSDSCSISCCGAMRTEPSALTRSTTPAKFFKSPCTITTWSPGRKLWSRPLVPAPSPRDAASASRFASAPFSLVPAFPPAAFASVASSPAA